MFGVRAVVQVNLIVILNTTCTIGRSLTLKGLSQRILLHARVITANPVVDIFSDGSNNTTVKTYSVKLTVTSTISKIYTF